MVGPELEALLLVGGYARGEGGVLIRDDGVPAPYNDYDLVAVVRGRASGHHARLEALGRRWSKFAQVDVDLWPVEARRLRTPPPTLFWLDAALGGARVLAGDASILEPLAQVTPRRVPLEEAARLLMNRAVGVALSRLETPEDPRRIERHVAKAVLACGDALLLAADRYRPTVEARRAELVRLGGAPGVEAGLVAAYADAAAWRRRPGASRRTSAQAVAHLDAMLEPLARWHLGLEAFRIGTPRSVLGYVTHGKRLFPRLPDVRAGGATAAALKAWLRASMPLRPLGWHARERLARAAVGLAYGRDQAALREAGALLGLEGLDLTTGPGREAARSALLALGPFAS